MRGKYVGFIAIAIVITVAIGFFASSDSQTEDDQSIVFHVTLADPQIYENGIYSHFLKSEDGRYELRFVPNGDSPKILTLTINGQSLNFFENFVLEGTPHETGVSTYSTWKYSGNKIIQVPNKQDIEILIDPNGNLLGPVSIDIMKI